MSNKTFYNLEEALKEPLETKELNIHHYNAAEEYYDSIGELLNLEKLTIFYYPKKYRLDFLKPLTNLKRLSLNSSNLEVIPEEIIQLSGLDYLNLEGNKLIDISPLTKLKKLKTLSLKYCGLKKLTDSLSKIPQLEYLYLEGNRLEALPESICQLKNLKLLDISKNKIKALPSDLGILPLVNLIVSKNPFYNQLNYKQRKISEFFRQMEKKQTPKKERKLYFQLFLGQIKAAQEFASHEEILEALNCFNPQVRNTAMAYLHSISENPFQEGRELRIYTIGKMSHLGEGSLSEKLAAKGIERGRKISDGITHIVLGEMPKEKLKEALKSGLPLVSSGYLKDLLSGENRGYLNEQSDKNEQMSKKIMNLLNTDDLANQELALGLIMGGGIHPSYYYDLLMLYLWNKRTKTRNITQKILEKFLPTDLYLHLKQNCRSYYDLPSEEVINQYLTNLEHEALESGELGWRFYQRTGKGKKFCLEQDSSFDKMIQLCIKNSVLNLKKIRLERLSPLIRGYTQLKCIYLNENSLESLPADFANLHQLSILSMAKNQLKNIPASVLEIEHIEILDFSDNQLEIIPEEISKLKNLKMLDLKGNKIQSIPESILELKQLKHLNLSGNKLGRNKKVQEWLKKGLPQCEIIFVLTQTKKELAVEK